MAHYDIIIIGTGAGGGTLARHLAPSGKKILLIERGDGCHASRRTSRPRRCSSTAVT
jgi:choline dehydrogenase-like flavoprotein